MVWSSKNKLDTNSTVMAEIEGVEGWVLFDTGASSAMLNRYWLKKQPKLANIKRYKVKPRKITVANSTIEIVDECVKVKYSSKGMNCE